MSVTRLVRDRMVLVIRNLYAVSINVIMCIYVRREGVGDGVNRAHYVT